MYIVETSRGAQAGGPGCKWWAAAHVSTLAQAREAMSNIFAAKADKEDRGEDMEASWMKLAERAESSPIDTPWAFDEFAARIVKGED